MAETTDVAGVGACELASREERRAVGHHVAAQLPPPAAATPARVAHSGQAFARADIRLHTGFRWRRAALGGGVGGDCTRRPVLGASGDERHEERNDELPWRERRTQSRGFGHCCCSMKPTDINKRGPKPTDRMLQYVKPATPCCTVDYLLRVMVGLSS